VKTTLLLKKGNEMNNQHTQWQLIEDIKTKAYQLDSISLIAQGGSVDGLDSEIIENLFGLMSNLSREILTLAENSISMESNNA